ncbi:MAG TPA: ATP-dependent Clp protease proteolytic subunit [Thermodesulfobacteriota bacterium]
MARISERQVRELITAVEDLLRRESIDRRREIYLVDDIDKESVKRVVEQFRTFASQSRDPITLYLNTPGGNVTDGLALYDVISQIVADGIEVSIYVQGMAYSMGSVVLQAASPGRRFAFPHSWIMIHEPAKWAGWQSTSSAAQHLDRLKAMQAQIYRILSMRSGQPLKQIIRDTKRTDFYLDAEKALAYGIIDAIVGRGTSTQREAAQVARRGTDRGVRLEFTRKRVAAHASRLAGTDGEGSEP